VASAVVYILRALQIGFTRDYRVMSTSTLS
jgi:hypothetical protein